MGLKKLRTLTINLEQDCGESGCFGDLRKLQKHPALQEIRLISNVKMNIFWVFKEAVTIRLAESLCHLSASQQLKVLSLMICDLKTKVNIQRFLLFPPMPHINAEG